ncbi:MAG: hypothetical protein M3O30_10195 [Planctomycetota bacterium]|nr:hypothetical protein [Planctomycetota bacterium]
MRNSFSLRWFMPVLVLGLTNIAMGAAFSSSNKWATWSNGGYSVENDVWGSGAGPQTIWANSFSNWGISTRQNNGGVKSYAHVKKTIGKTTSSLRSCTSSFNVSLPATGVYNASYDCWVPSEVMVWMSRAGGDNPIAKGYDAHGNAIPSFTNVNVGGHTFNVYIGGNPRVVSFVRTRNTSSGTVDLKAVLQHALSNRWISNGTISNIQFGFEVVSTNNSTQNLRCNSYSLSFK